MSNSDDTLVVPAALFPLCDGKQAHRRAFVEVWAERAPEVAKTGRDGFVSFEDGGFAGKVIAELAAVLCGLCCVRA